MARKRSLLRGVTIDDILSEAITRRTLRRKDAARMYAFKYTTSNPKWAGWLLFALNELDKHRDELMKADKETRAKMVWQIMSEAKDKWRKLSEDEKRQWIEKAKTELSARLAEYKKLVEEAREFEKVVEEAYESIEKAVAEIVE